MNKKNQLKLYQCCYFLLLLVCSTFSLAETEYDIKLKSVITGSSEQPALIFILPWRDDIKTEFSDGKIPFDAFDIFKQPVNKRYLDKERYLKLNQPN